MLKHYKLTWLVSNVLVSYFYFNQVSQFLYSTYYKLNAFILFSSKI